MAVLKKSVDSEKIKEELKWAINGIDIVGCELTQNIAKKLKEKEKGISKYPIENDRQKDRDGYIMYFLDMEDHGTPLVVDYANEELRNRIINPDEIIIPDEKITLRITYPLSVKVNYEREHKGGYSRKLLFEWIYQAYKKIYEEEERQVGDPGTYEMLYNRKNSEGRYGIWGHYMNDLYLEFIRYDPKTKIIHLAIGS